MKKQIFKARPYQKFAIEKIIENPAVSLMLDMGLGKTIITLSAIQDLIYKRYEVQKVLVIAPLRVAETTWLEENLKWQHLNLKIVPVLGTEDQRLSALKKSADVYVINRENVQWLIQHYRKNFPFDMLVIDESSSFKNPQAKELNITFEVYSSETCINISNNLLYKDIDPNNWHYFTLDIFLNIPKNHQRKYLLFGFENYPTLSQLKIVDEIYNEVKYLSAKSNKLENYLELENDHSYFLNLTLTSVRSFSFYFAQSNFYNKIFQCEINTEYFQQIPIYSETKILLDMTSIIKGNKMLIEYEYLYPKDIKVYGYYSEDKDIIKNTSGEELKLIEYDKCQKNFCQHYLRKNSADLKYAIIKISSEKSSSSINIKYGKQEKYFPTTIYLSCGIGLAVASPNIFIYI